MLVLFPAAFIAHCKQQIVSVQVHWLLTRESCILMTTKANLSSFSSTKYNFFLPLPLTCFSTKELIYGARYLWTRFRIDGIKAMSLGISGGKEVLKFANTSNRGRLKQFDNFRHAKCTVRVSTSLTLLLLDVRTTDLRSCCIKKITTITSTTSTHNFHTTAISCIGRFYHLFAPWETTCHSF